MNVVGKRQQPLLSFGCYLACTQIAQLVQFYAEIKKDTRRYLFGFEAECPLAKILRLQQPALDSELFDLAFLLRRYARIKPLFFLLID